MRTHIIDGDFSGGSGGSFTKALQILASSLKNLVENARTQNFVYILAVSPVLSFWTMAFTFDPREGTHSISLGTYVPPD